MCRETKRLPVPELRRVRLFIAKCTKYEEVISLLYLA